MDWAIELPHYGDPDDLVLEVITAAREKFGDDQRTQLVEVLARDALHNRSITSVGGLLDDLGGLDQAGCPGPPRLGERRTWPAEHWRG